MVTEVAQDLIDVLISLWERSNESRRINWPVHIQMQHGTSEPAIGTLDFECIYKELRVQVPVGRLDWNRLRAHLNKPVDQLAGDLWLTRANKANGAFLLRYTEAEMKKVPHDAVRQIYQVPTESFPLAAAVFWSYGQALTLTVDQNGFLLLGAGCFLAHGKPSQLREQKPTNRQTFAHITTATNNTAFGSEVSESMRVVPAPDVYTLWQEPPQGLMMPATSPAAETVRSKRKGERSAPALASPDSSSADSESAGDKTQASSQENESAGPDSNS